MATYKKPSVSVFVYTVMDNDFQGDGATYEALKAHKTAEIKGVENTVLVPFHAVKQYQKSVSSADVEAVDAYCE